MRRMIIVSMMLMIFLCGCNENDAMTSETDIIIEDTSPDIPSVENSSEDMRDEDAVFDDEFKVMEGMKYLYDFSEGTNGYCIVVTGDEKRGEGIMPKAIELGKDNELDIVIESVVENTDMRKMALQILVDYVQVPFVVDGKIYDTYYIEAEDNISLTKQIRLAADIDRNVDHKIVIMLLNDLQVHASDLEIPISATASASNQLLVCGGEKNKLIRPEQEYETVIGQYEEAFFGIFLTQNADGDKKVIPHRIIHAKPGQTVKVYYHLGGFIDSSEILVFLNVGEKQAKINGKDFLLLQTQSQTQILFGEAEFTAPMEEGQYEVSAWAVNNPYGEIPEIIQAVLGSPRFTLSVEK